MILSSVIKLVALLYIEYSRTFFSFFYCFLSVQMLVLSQNCSQGRTGCHTKSPGPFGMQADFSSKRAHTHPLRPNRVEIEA